MSADKNYSTTVQTIMWPSLVRVGDGWQFALAPARIVYEAEARPDSWVCRVRVEPAT